MIHFRHLMEALLNPFFLLILFMLLVFLIKPGRFSVLLILLFSLAISTGWLAKCLTLHLEKQYSPVTTVDPNIQWAVVLSGGQAEMPDNPAFALLYSTSIKRLLEGVRLWRLNPKIHLLLSGGGYGSEKAEADRMRELADWFAIPASQLAIEDQSLNTEDQARAIKTWVGDQPFYLVTSAVHMPRAMALCEAQGLKPIAAPTDYTLYWSDERWQKMIIPNPQNIVRLSVAWHEILGMAWWKMTSKINLLTSNEKQLK